MPCFRAFAFGLRGFPRGESWRRLRYGLFLPSAPEREGEHYAISLRGSRSKGDGGKAVSSGKVTTLRLGETRIAPSRNVFLSTAQHCQNTLHLWSNSATTRTLGQKHTFPSALRAKASRRELASARHGHLSLRNATLKAKPSSWYSRTRSTSGFS